MCAMLLHQRPHLIDSVNETGHKLTYSSSNVKLVVTEKKAKLRQ
jgi:hypothetical protein